MDWLNPRLFKRSEILWITGFFGVVGSLSLFPYLIFAAMTPEHQHYAWASTFYNDDYYQYYAWANHIVHGDWLIRNYYTHDPSEAFGLFNPYFLLLGWTTRIFGNVYFASHLLRLLAIGAFSWISYAFCALFLAEPRARRAAQLLMFGGGIEYPVFQAFGTRFASPLADPYVFKILYRYGHLTAALCLLLLIFGTYANSCVGAESSRNRAWLAQFFIAICVMILGLINPYYLVLAAGVLAAHAAWRLARRDLRPLPLGIAAAIGALIPALHYAFQSFSARPEAIAFDDPIGPTDLLCYYIFLLPWAVAGWIRPRATDGENRPRLDLSFLCVWGLTVFVFALTPIAFRARTVFGVQIALVIPAAAWLSRGKFTAIRHWPIYALMAMELGYTFYKESLDFRYNNVGRIDKGLMAAFEYLDQHAKPGEVVLTMSDPGDFLPAYCPANTYVGHSFQTLGFPEKQKEVTRFFTWDTDEQRLELLKRIGGDYVLVPPLSSEYRAAFRLPGWRRVYAGSGYEIYRPAL